MSYIKRVHIDEIDQHGGRWFIRVYTPSGALDPEEKTWKYFITDTFQLVGKSFHPIESSPRPSKLIKTTESERPWFTGDLGCRGVSEIYTYAGLYPFSNKLLTALQSQDINRVSKLIKLDINYFSGDIDYA